MKRYLSILLALTLLLALTACAVEPVATEPPAPEPEPAPVVVPPAPLEPFPGKIAIITNTISGNELEYRSAEQVKDKYGEDKIIHITLPDNFGQEQEQMVEILAEIAADPEVRALVINVAVPETSAEIAKLREMREDIFVVYCSPQEDPPHISRLANLALYEDGIGMGPAMVQQAYKMGAKTFVHYSFPRHMSITQIAARYNLIQEECEKLGIEFVGAESIDPARDVGVAGAQQFILDDVPKMVAKYGKDTAFFCTNSSMQSPLIKAVADEGGIYPQPDDPSPYYYFPAALLIETPEEGFPSTDYLITEITRRLDEMGVLGRFSTWPASIEMLFTSTGVEYAIKRLNGEVTQEGIDVDALKQCMEDYAGVECFIQPHANQDGMEYPNLYLVREDYITFGEEYVRGVK